MTDPKDREELLRLREENLRLREERLSKGSGPTSPPPLPTTVHVKQVNEGCFSGCAGIIGLFFVIAIVLKACGG